MPLYGFKNEDHWTYLQPSGNVGINLCLRTPSHPDQHVHVKPHMAQSAGLYLINFLKKGPAAPEKVLLGAPVGHPHDQAFLRFTPYGGIMVDFPVAYMEIKNPKDIEGFVEAWTTLSGMPHEWHAYQQWKAVQKASEDFKPMTVAYDELAMKYTAEYSGTVQKYGIKPPLTEKEGATYADYVTLAMKYKDEYSGTMQKVDQAASDEFKDITAILKEANKKVAGPTPVAIQPVRQFEDIDGEKAPPLVVEATKAGATLSVTSGDIYSYAVSLTPPQIEKLILALNAVPQETSMTTAFVALDDDHQIKVKVTGKEYLTHAPYATVKIATPGSLTIFTKETTQALASFLLQVLIERE